MPRRLSFTRLSMPQQPLVFLALAFIGGLLLAAEFSISLRVWLAMAAALWLLALVCVWMRRHAWVNTAALLMSCLACGGTLWALNEAAVSESRIKKLFEHETLTAAEPVELWGRLTAAPELAPDRIYLSVEAERVATKMREYTASGVVQLVVPFADEQARKEYDELNLDYGSRVRVLAYLSNARGYRNPGAPDFDEMLEHHGYDAAGAIKSPLLIERLGDGKRNAALAWLYHLRARALTTMRRSFKPPALGLLAASLFGNRYFLDHETGEAFRAGGTFHLLVISGLHVALLAGVLLWLTKRLIPMRIFRYGVVIAFLWGYGLMVGAEPSITRAVVMISIALIAQLVFRTSIGANTLAATALTLLAWRPSDLFNPGFQLSFLTVLMIVMGTVPLYYRLKSIGEWQPSEQTPYPPRAPAWVKWCAEVLFWNETAFRQEMARAPIHYRLEKASAARWVSVISLRHRIIEQLEKARATRWVSRIGFRHHLIAQPGVRGAVLTLLTTSCVQIGLLPLMIAYFHRVSLIAPIANVIESVMVFALMMAGAMYLLIHAVSAGAALKLAGLVNALGSLTAHAANPLLGFRGGSFRVPDYGSWSAFIYAVYFALILLLIIKLNEWNPLAQTSEKGEGERRKISGRGALTFSSLTLAVLFLLLVWHPFEHEYERGRLSVTFLDVGQGDAIAISFPRGALMMVDSGGRPPIGAKDETDEAEDVFVEDRVGIGETAVAPYLWRRGVKRLDFIVATHGHSDHTQGFADLARSFKVGAAMTGVTPSGNDPQFALLCQAAKEAEVKLRPFARGDSFELDGVRVEALAPFRDALGAAVSGNNQSLVLRLSYGQRTFLLTGDIERPVEERLIAAHDDLHTDVLKVAHHGSRTSSTLEFLKRAAPRYAVISVAAPSPFGHPHAEVLDRLQQSGARVLQTSECGAITISTDGNDLRVSECLKRK